MKLTEATDLRRFVGGQIEVQNSQEGYLYRGQIKTLQVTGQGDDAKLCVELDWMAKSDGPGSWIKDDKKPYEASLMIYSVSDIGGNRLCLNSPIVGELTVLFPKGGSTLDRSKVKGL